MANEDFEHKPTYDRFGNLQSSEYEAHKSNYGGGSKQSTSNELGDGLIGGMKAIGNYLEQKTEEGHADTAQRVFILQAIRQLLDLYNAGDINGAVNSAKSCISQNRGNRYLDKLETVLQVMLYSEGRFQEAANCGGEKLLTVFCLEKLGDKEKASKTLLSFFKSAGVTSFDTRYIPGYETTIFGGWKKRNLDFYMDFQFDFDKMEICPLIIARAEEGNKNFFYLTGRIYEHGYKLGKTEVKPDEVTAKKWYDKAVENNDPEALYSIAYNLRIGMSGYPKDRKKSFEYLKKAAELGHPFAEEDLHRNGFVSFLFGLVISAGFAGTFYLIYWLLKFDIAVLVLLGIIGSLIAGFVMGFIAWRNRRNILLLILLAISIPGIIYGISEITKSSNVVHTYESGETIQVGTLKSSESMRTSPSWNANYGPALRRGTNVTLLGKRVVGKDTWIFVEYEGQTGWIVLNYVSIPKKVLEGLQEVNAGN